MTRDELEELRQRLRDLMRVLEELIAGDGESGE